MEYFIDTPIELFYWCSIRVKQFMSGNNFETILYALKFPPPPSPPTIEINYLNIDRLFLHGIILFKESSYRIGSHAWMNLCPYG